MAVDIITADGSDTTLDQRYLLNRDNWYKYLKLSKSNPAIMMKAGFDYLEAELEGELTVVDASNPFTLGTEIGVTAAANNFKYFSEADKKHYPSLATEMSDLYHHMGDQLYEGRFAVPGTATFTLAMVKQEVVNSAIQTTVTNQSKLIIPRGTTFTIDGIVFTLLKSIDIRVSSYGAIQVIYTDDSTDPLMDLESNILNYYYATSREDVELLVVEIPLLQVRLESYNAGLTHQGNILNNLYSITDDFCLARVYLDDDGEGPLSRYEISTTHSNLIYDADDPTARLKLVDSKTLQVDIPIIYYNLDSVNQRTVEIEIYSTLGNKSLPLVSMSESSATVMTLSDDSLTDEETKYSAPLDIMQKWVAPTTDLIGGSDGLDFSTLKKWVIQGGRYKEAPITQANLEMNANILGYDLIKDIDHVTNRIFQATRELETDDAGNFERGMGCSIESVMIRIDQLEAHAAVNVHSDTNRVTLTPDALFYSKDGVTTLLDPDDIPTLANDSATDSYLAAINSLEYIMTPFHYCFDSSGTDFKITPYYMDAPSYISQKFIQANHLIDLTAAVDSTVVSRSTNGYQVKVTLRSSDNFKELDYEDIFVQLAFTPDNQTSMGYVNGRFIGTEDGNHVYLFDINTTFDFDDSNNLIVNNFKILTKEDRTLSCPLKTEFRVVIGVYDYADDVESAPIDDRAAKFLLTKSRIIKVVAENAITLRLGWVLSDLWHNSRTMSSTLTYKRYSENIPLTYTENIYKLNENNLPKYTIVNGQYVFEVEHAIGDTVLSSSGEPIYLHKKGEIMLDDKGEPVMELDRTTLRLVDLFFMDGIYRFSTYSNDIAYRSKVPETVVNWLETDIARLKRRRLENTDIFFMPKRTMGYVNIIAEGGVERTIFNRLPFSVKFYVNSNTYYNSELREAIRTMTSSVVNKALQGTTISKDTIEHELREQGGTDIIYGVNVTDMGIGSDINTFTMVDNGSQCSVRRKIELQSDRTFRVKEDITITFINHDKKL